ncbi:MAG TPA: branched-chain amino acid ABC transporter permease [Myxococcaceae bacterium]|jgi:branched-chain amino acid transport system permease protein|nr:branched-chain amino acid ABC transporter permease [Myxococcaceae bacterium]
MESFLATYASVFQFMLLNGLLALSVYATLCCGQLSLANAGFMCIGAFASAVLTQRASAPFPLALAAGALVPALLAVPLGFPVLRLRGVFLAIATIGFGEMVRVFFVNWDYTNGALGLVAIPQHTTTLLLVASVAAVTFFFARLRGSRIGYALEALREDEPAASTLGIDPARYKLAMFVLGAAIAGLAGALEAHLTFMVAPSGYGFGRAVDMLVWAVVGGISRVGGPLLGAFFLTALPEALRAAGHAVGLAPGPLRMGVNGLILLAVVLFLPNGLVAAPAAVRALLRRRKART